jgi:uncharacterized protein YjdB
MSGNYQITINKDNSADLNYKLGYSQDFLDFAQQSGDGTDPIEELMTEYKTAGFTVSDIVEGDYTYVIATKHLSSVNEINSIKMDDNVSPGTLSYSSIKVGDKENIHFGGEFDYTADTLNQQAQNEDPNAEPQFDDSTLGMFASAMDFKFTLTLPYKVTASNATRVLEDGKSYQWDLTPAKRIDATLDATKSLISNNKVTSVSLVPKNVTMHPAQTVKLTASVVPQNAKNKAVKWTTSDKKVATVNTSGLVTAVGNGTATISVTTTDGNKVSSSKITVITPVSAIQLNKSTLTLTLKQTATLSSKVYPETASNKKVKWSSSDLKIAMVTKTGKIIPKSKGKVSITGTTMEGNKTATCKVTIK